MSLTARLMSAAAGVSLAVAVAACGTVTYSQDHGNLPVPVFSFRGNLERVASASPGDAWAVGFSGTFPNVGTLMLHWDGTAWSRVTSPAVLDGAPGVLNDVTVVSATDAWAVGFTGRDRSAGRTPLLLLHWDGTRWSRVTVMQATAGELSGIAMSSHGGWAVGAAAVAGHLRPLILRWDGAGWHPVPAPAGPGDLSLSGVVVTSGGTAFASGAVYRRGPPVVAYSVLMRWNGSSWQWASFPIAGPANSLFGMAAGPDGTAWAVGQDATYTSLPSANILGPPLAMRWTGATWQKVHVPGGKAGFCGVTVAPGGAVWAVGSGDGGPVAMRWTGGAWAEVPVPTGAFLEANGGVCGVAFSSPTDGWAVGAALLANTGKQAGYRPLIVHWDGTAWN
jgi:hypothetical protein